MRLLHTSDWHIGRTFHGHSLLADQEAVLGAMGEIIDRYQVDAVLIAGDLYDRAIPAAEATQLATRVISAIRARGAEVIAISGNHDSAPRLGAFADLLAAGGFHLRTDPARLADPVLLGPGLAIYAIPYLEPDLLRADWGLPARCGHQAVLGYAMDQVRRDLASRPAGTRSVVLCHAFVTGGRASESERSIAVGGVESVAADVFDGVDYVALGHLHSRQELADRLRYSGSPLPYSFGERSGSKGVYLVDIEPGRPIEYRWLDLPVIRPLATVRGTLAEILGGGDDLADHYLAVTLTDPVQPIDAMRRLRERFRYAVTLAWEPPGAAESALSFPVISQAIPDDALIDQFLRDCRGAAPDESERQLIGDITARLRAAQVTR